MGANVQRVRLGAATYAVYETLPMQTKEGLHSGRKLRDVARSDTAPLRNRQWHVP